MGGAERFVWRQHRSQRECGGRSAEAVMRGFASPLSPGHHVDCIALKRKKSPGAAVL